MSSAKKNNSTMRHSKRNIGSVYGSEPDRIEDSKVRDRSHDISKSIRYRVSVSSEPEPSAGTIFCRMVPHIWFRLLPSDDQNCDTVAFVVGQEWELISALFQDVKMLKKGR